MPLIPYARTFFRQAAVIPGKSLRSMSNSASVSGPKIIRSFEFSGWLASVTSAKPNDQSDNRHDTFHAKSFIQSQVRFNRMHAR